MKTNIKTAIKFLKIHAGFYVFRWHNITFHCSLNTERDSSWYRMWIVTAFRGDGATDILSSDPVNTLRDCREQIADLIANPYHYRLILESER